MLCKVKGIVSTPHYKSTSLWSMYCTHKYITDTHTHTHMHVLRTSSSSFCSSCTPYTLHLVRYLTRITYIFSTNSSIFWCRRMPLGGSVTAGILLQQPIPVFDRVHTLARSSTDFYQIRRASAHCRADDLRISTLAICVLPHGRPRITTWLPSENLCGVSAEKGKFSVSRTVW